MNRRIVAFSCLGLNELTRCRDVGGPAQYGLRHGPELGVVRLEEFQVELSGDVSSGVNDGRGIARFRAEPESACF